MYFANPNYRGEDQGGCLQLEAQGVKNASVAVSESETAEVDTATSSMLGCQSTCSRRWASPDMHDWMISNCEDDGIGDGNDSNGKHDIQLITTRLRGTP
jgi:hypothetical protein